MARVTADRKINATVAGARFVDGMADTDNEGALEFFRRRDGYTVEDAPKRRRKTTPKDDAETGDVPAGEGAPAEEVPEQ